MVSVETTERIEVEIRPHIAAAVAVFTGIFILTQQPEWAQRGYDLIRGLTPSG
jgi:hypothetical protein